MEELNQVGEVNQYNRKHAVSPREIVLKYLPFIPWVLASLFLFMTIAFLKLRYSPNIYNVSGTIMIKEPTSVGNRPDKIEEMLFTNPNKNINDEIQVIRSRNMGKRVVRSLGLEIMYFNQGKIRSSQISTKESPFTLNIIFLKDSMMGFNLSVTLLNDQQFTLVDKGQPVLFGQPFETQAGRFSLTRTGINFAQFVSPIFFINYTPTDQRADQLAGGLGAVQSGESNNILQLTYQTENPRIGVDIVNQWMREYQQVGLEDKKQIAVNTLRFIDEQMDTVKFELGGVEKNLLGYREKNRIINPEQQTIQVFNTLSELEKDITTQNVQLQVVDNLIAYIGDTRSPYRQVASTLGIDEPSLAYQITEFNKLQVERETILKTTTRTNPMVVNLETSIEKLRQDIFQNLRNVRQAYQLSLNNLLSRNRMAGQEISQIPVKEKQLLDITRRQKILEELFSFLLQKKLETSIGSASAISNVRVIEPALASGGPVLPNRPGTYTMAFFLGLAIPTLIIFLKEFLNDKVKSREDIQRATQAPIIGEVGHADDTATLVVSRTSRRFIAEQFRIIRTNMEYILPKSGTQVIIVTSSSSGEGKSFMSSNIGAVKALTGKKTVIMEFDIRKPKVAASLNVKHKTGISNFVLGKASFEDIVVPVPGVDNLFMIPCGPVPPNPSELLLDEKIDELIAHAKAAFDVVVIDTAPLGLVSDPVILGKFADATIYVIRHNHTYKKQLNMLNEIYLSKRLPHLSIVVNDIKADGGYGNYYGYGGYGYTGYGYGYGNEYFDESKTPLNILSRLKSFFSRS